MRMVADEQWRPTLRMRYTVVGMPLDDGPSGRVRALLTDEAFYLSAPSSPATWTRSG